MRALDHVFATLLALALWGICQLASESSGEFLWEVLVVMIIVGVVIDYIRHDLYWKRTDPIGWRLRYIQRHYRLRRRK